MDTYWTLLQKCNNLEIFSCEIESQSGRVDSVPSLPENKILELSVKSNIFSDGDLVCTVGCSPRLVVLNLNNCRKITLIGVQFTQLKDLATKYFRYY